MAALVARSRVQAHCIHVIVRRLGRVVSLASCPRNLKGALTHQSTS